MNDQAFVKMEYIRGVTLPQVVPSQLSASSLAQQFRQPDYHKLFVDLSRKRKGEQKW